MRHAEPRETKGFGQAQEGGFAFVAREAAFETRHREETVDETVYAGMAE